MCAYNDAAIELAAAVVINDYNSMVMSTSTSRSCKFHVFELFVVEHIFWKIAKFTFLFYSRTA